MSADSSGKGSPSAKKRKQAISSEFKKQIKEDEENTKIWNDVIEAVSGGEVTSCFVISVTHYVVLFSGLCQTFVNTNSGM